MQSKLKPLTSKSEVKAAKERQGAKNAKTVNQHWKFGHRSEQVNVVLQSTGIAIIKGRGRGKGGCGGARVKRIQPAAAIEVYYFTIVAEQRSLLAAEESVMDATGTFSATCTGAFPKQAGLGHGGLRILLKNLSQVETRVRITGAAVNSQPAQSFSLYSGGTIEIARADLDAHETREYEAALCPAPHSGPWSIQLEDIKTGFVTTVHGDALPQPPALDIYGRPVMSHEEARLAGHNPSPGEMCGKCSQEERGPTDCVRVKPH